MGRKLIRELIIVITYTVALILIIVNFNKVITGLWRFIRLFNPFFSGVAIAFVLHKPCYFIERLLEKKLLKKRHTLARGLAIFSVYVIILFLFSLIIRFIIPQLLESVVNLVNNTGTYLNNLQNLINKYSDYLDIENVDFSSISSILQTTIRNIGQSISQVLTHIINITTGVLTFIATSLIAIVFSIYLLAGKERLLSQVKRIFKTYLPYKIFRKLAYVFHIVNDVFTRYIVGQLTEAIILGILCFLGMLIFRFDYALLISVIIAITALIPVVGAYLGGGIAFLLLIIISPRKAFLFLIYILVLQQFEGNVIYPKVVGNKLGLPSIWVLLSITVGGGLFGPIGILLGVPIATVIYSIIREDLRRRENANPGGT